MSALRSSLSVPPPHPRSLIRFVRKTRQHPAHFRTRDGKVLFGLHGTMQRLFYPAYSKTAATLTSSERIDWPSFSASNRHSAGYQRPPRNAAAGMSLGSRFDDQVRQTIRIRQRYDLPASFFYDKNARDRRLFRSPIPVSIIAKCNNLLPYTYKFWMAMNTLELTPVLGQLPVGIPESRVGTAVDVVCYHKHTGKWCLLELKTGYESTVLKCTRQRMRYPFDMRTDCPFNQHQIQLMLTQQYYKETFPVLRDRLLPPKLLYFVPLGWRMFELEPWVSRQAGAALEVIAGR